MPWYQHEFDRLHAVAVGTLTPEGALVDANDGLLDLVQTEAAPNPVGTSVTTYFIQPSFAAIMAGSATGDAELYSGLITVGAYGGNTYSLVARIWRTGAEIRILAEYNIKELLRLNDTVLELNRDYGVAQLELAQANLRLQQHEAEIRKLSLTDQLTGVGNRRRLEQAVKEEISRAGRSGAKLSALMADLDHFKHVNDTYGHGAGDKVLETFGDILRQSTRLTDVLGRYGGEEFVVLMPNTDRDQAVISAERLRVTFAATLIPPLPEPITVSIGAVEWAPGQSGDVLLRRVDQALYEAKRTGRNRVVAA
ncbi:MAG: GGDEF domain-containing protein [Methylovirgula sp.]